MINKLLSNGFLLLIPVLTWNLTFASSLPEYYAKDQLLLNQMMIAENSFRLLAFLLPAFFQFSIGGHRRRIGLMIYVAGTLIYFASWIPLLLDPGGSWASSPWGALAPAVTPALWLAGINMMICEAIILKRSLPFLFLGAWTAFLAFHNFNTYVKFLGILQSERQSAGCGLLSASLIAMAFLFYSITHRKKLGLRLSHARIAVEGTLAVAFLTAGLFLLFS